MADVADPRLTPARPDLAADHLEGIVRAERYAAPTALVATTPTAPVTDRPDADAPMTTELLHGERFEAYETGPAWVWGRCAADGYVGYAPAACFGPDRSPARHRVAALAAHVYPEPDIKTRPVGVLPFGARVAADLGEGAFWALSAGGYVVKAHLAPIATVEADWVAAAERFLGVPYLWGGRSPAGIDCSGLVQVARQAGGFDCPRDSDMQEAAPARAPSALRRGDLIFWRGHVGIMTSPTRLLHANAHHMAVVVEPLAEAEARIEAHGGGRPTARRRWPGALRKTAAAR
jgi:cell wall-associated NlpC family hydrolase